MGKANKYMYICQAKGRRRTSKFKHSCSTTRLSHTFFLSFFCPFIILIFIKLSAVIPVTVRLILIKLMTTTQLNYDQRLYRNPISIVLILSNQLRDVSPPRLISTIRAKFTKLLNNEGSFALRNVSDGKEIMIPCVILRHWEQFCHLLNFHSSLVLRFSKFSKYYQRDNWDKNEHLLTLMFYQTPMTFSPDTQKEKFSLVHTMKMSVKGLSSSNKKATWNNLKVSCTTFQGFSSFVWWTNWNLVVVIHPYSVEKNNSDILLMNNYSVTERQKVNADTTLFLL